MLMKGPRQIGTGFTWKTVACATARGTLRFSLFARYPL
jgi:hypothetical protein